jgi:hypothetical protein
MRADPSERCIVVETGEYLTSIFMETPAEGDKDQECYVVTRSGGVKREGS